jgi:GNAT superfamily N-acetyltransferase
MQTSRITIEQADTVRDLDALVPLVDAYRVFYGQASDTAGSRAFVRERFEQRDTLFFVARRDDGLVGFAHLLFSLETVALRRIGILEDVYVADGARRTGTGGALLDAATDYARKSGLARLTLSTAHQNRPAQRLYLRHGYVPDQRFRSFNLFLDDPPAD